MSCYVMWMGETHACGCLFILDGVNPWACVFVYTLWGKSMSLFICLYSMGKTHELMHESDWYVMIWCGMTWHVRTYVFHTLLQ